MRIVQYPLFDKMSKLTCKQISALVEMYKNHSALWDCTIAAYKNKDTRKLALLWIQIRFEDLSGPTWT